MSAPTRSASRSPRLLRHTVARGSLAGLGVLVASTAFAPTALAEDGGTEPTTPEQAPEQGTGTAPAVNEVPQAAVPLAAAANLLPDFGTGKQFRLAAPLDANTADGAGYTFLDADGEAVGVCEPWQGNCTVHSTPGEAWSDGSDVYLPEGPYTVARGGTPFAALSICLPVTGLGSIEDYFDGLMNGRGCGNGPEIPVADGVVLQTEIDVQVVDAASGDPVSGAGFRLTGPSYARTPLPAPPTVVRQLPTLDLPTLDVPTLDVTAGDATTDENATDGAATDGATTVPEVAATTGEEADGGFDISALGSTSDTTYPGTNGSDPDVYDGGAAVTDEDGSLIFTGWFAPGSWTLTPIAVPDGYDPPAVASVTVASADVPGGPVEQTVTLYPLGTTPPTTPESPVSTPPLDTPAVVTPPAVVTLPPAAPAGGAAGGSAPAAAVNRSTGGGTGSAASASQTATASSTAAAPSTSRASSATARSTTPVQAGEPSAPQLETESSSIPEAGLVGLGVLLVAAVVLLFGLVRRRARARG